jgi:hypothetical protein
MSGKLQPENLNRYDIKIIGRFVLFPLMALSNLVFETTNLMEILSMIIYQRSGHDGKYGKTTVLFQHSANLAKI